MSDFSFENATNAVSDLQNALEYYCNPNNEPQDIPEDQAHFNLMKAYALISAGQCFPLLS